MSGGQKISMKGLIKDLKNKEEDVRKSAVFKLGEMKAHEAVEAIGKLLKGDPVPLIRRFSATALGKIKSEDAVSPLCEALSDNDYYVKQFSARSLGKIKDSRAIEPLLRLIKGGGGKIYTATGSETEVKKGKKGDNETLKTEGMKYTDVQVNAIKALGEIGNEKAVGPLIAELDDEEGNIRCAIALALGKIGSKTAVPKLVELLNDKIWYVRRDVAIALSKIKDIRSVDALVDKIDDKYEEVGEQSVRAITKIGKAAMAKTFLLKPKNEMVKNMIKKNFKSKKEIAQGLIEATELETDPAKREKLKSEIQKLFGPK